MLCLSKYLTRDCVSKRDLREFCVEAFETELRENDRYCRNKKVELRIVNLPVRENGNLRLRFFRKRKRATLTINIRHILREKECSVQMKYVFLYSIIVHELEHLHLFRLLENAEIPNYAELIAAWDQFWHHWGTKNDIWNRLFSPKRKTQRQYDSSPAELYCNYVGMKRAYEIFKKDLSEDNLRKIEKMLESLSLIASNQEIKFYRATTPSDLFPTTIKHMQMLLRGKRKYADKLPIVRRIITENGSVISIEEIMKRMEEPGKELYENILVRLFVYVEGNWGELFERDPNMKRVLNELSDEYCKSAIQFLMNQETVRIFLSNEIVQENAGALVRNIRILKQQMKKHGMESKVGGVFPLYRH